MTEAKSKKQSGRTPLEAQIEKSKSPRRKNYVLDLRIHSPASLGYLGIEGIDTAPAMVRLAKVKGLDMIAVTDFYSANFIERVHAAAEGTKLTVLPGTSIRCRLDKCDEVDLVCLFPESHRKLDIENFLVDLGVERNQFGNEKYVLEMPFSEILHCIDTHGGFAIPSRMDKTPHRMKVIPLLVEQFGFRTFDMAYADSKQYFKANWPKLHFNLYSFSSASALAQVGSRSVRVKLPTPSFEAIRDVAAREVVN